MAYISLPDRGQLTFMNKLDDLVSPEHPVRVIDTVVERLVQENPGLFALEGSTGTSRTGRPAYPPALMLKLYIYGYLIGVSSSRKLQAEAQRNIELIWMLNTQTPDFKTIADYRKDNGDHIKWATRKLTEFLRDNGYITGQRLAVDGTKLKAYTGDQMLTRQKIDDRLNKAHQLLENYLVQLAQSDQADEQLEAGYDGQEDDPGKSTGPEALEEIDRLQRRIAQLEAQKAELENQQTEKISPADPEARLMRSAKVTQPSYNLQIGVDSEHKMIALGRITNEGNDFEQLIPMYNGLTEWLGARPKELLADTGYCDLGDIKAIQEQGFTLCYVPENNTVPKKKKIQFTYNPDEDRYYCSQNRPLERVGKGYYDSEKQAFIETYRGTQCQTCPIQSQCTSAASARRSLKVFHGAKWREHYRRQLASRKGRMLVRQRKALAEHPFGTLKYWMGRIPLLLRGKDKVQTEIYLYVSAYNVKRLTGCACFKRIISQINAYNWKVNLS
ncbi:MAG: IS1182 family transposase, partial [Balneolaceae bacterium]